MYVIHKKNWQNAMMGKSLAEFGRYVSWNMLLLRKKPILYEHLLFYKSLFIFFIIILTDTINILNFTIIMLL